MIVWVSGANGFTGRHLVAHLTDVGHQVYSSQADLMDADAIRDEIQQVQPQGIIHLAGISSPRHRPQWDFYRVNTLGTRHLLDAIGSLAVRPTAIIMASSATVYGAAVADTSRLRETIPAQPTGRYAHSKFLMERDVLSSDMPITLVRPFNYTGPGQSEQFIIPKLVNAFARRQPVIDLGNVNIARDFSYISDVVRVYAALLNQTPRRSEIINLCSGNAQSLDWVLYRLSVITKHMPGVNQLPSLMRANEPAALWGDTARLQQRVGFAPVPLTQGHLEHMVQVAQANLPNTQVAGL